MDRLKRPGDTEYDVLGLSPRATLDEINETFHQLIEKGGYRERLPLRSQWQRAREIKAAHATLSDPASRAVYDESLSRLFASAPAVSDSKADELPSLGKDAAEQPAPSDAPVAATFTVSPFQWGTSSDDASERPRHLIVPDLDSPADDEEPTTVQADESDHANTSERRPIPPPVWASAGTAALALGLLLYVFPPDFQERSGAASNSGRPAQQSTASARNESGTPWASLVEVRRVANKDASTQSVASVDPARRDEPAAEVRSAEERLPASSDVSARARASTAEREGQHQRAVVTVDAAPVPEEPPAPTGSASPTSGGPLTRTIILSPTPQQVAAAASLTGSAAPVVSGAPSTGRAVGKSLGSPARFIGGGPTNADNRRGRYRGVVAVEFTIEPHGHVSRCVTMRSSGDAALDQMTCRLVEQRVRYNPATDSLGRPTTSVASATYVWGRRRRP